MTETTDTNDTNDSAGTTKPPAAAASAPGRPAWLRPALDRTLVRHLLPGALALIVLCAVTAALPPFQDLQVANIATYVCAVAGLTVLTGLNGQISLGHGALMAVGAYGTGLFLTNLAWPLPVALVAGTAVTAAVGALVGTAAARLQGPYLAGATLTLAVGLPALANYRHLSDLLGGENGLVVATPPPPAALGAYFPLERWQAWICLLCAVVVLVLLADLGRSRVGRSWRAIRDDEDAAALAGIPVARLRVLAFVVSAACAGLGGGLLAVVSSLAAPGAFPLALSLSLLTGAVLGGLGSLAGAVYGSIALVLLPTWTGDVADALHLSRGFYANLPLALFGLVLVLSMLVFPQGIQGALVRLARRLRAGRRAPS
ncbi:branched-chain amino acid ABC transporter permease [Streptomyces sp. MI02-7b]|uniref:branched-chain amino acid ABC transporter permease n=1 Tax=Streptomyces sp. MI02-7b TaxID=462941 RepID=UPI0029B18874|nr:branched-chain amino acid ABC transporter permease [Streptomyces sp. MI02-7b]MDX3077453.1 branched-chain amino acid ABC transporter permease [Streptomyces sp. MI02-7b]